MTLAQGSVATVDMDRCVQNYKKGEEQRRKLKDEWDSAVRGLAAESRKLDAMKESLNSYKEGSSEWSAAAKKLKLGQAELELRKQAVAFEYQHKLAALLEHIYADVRRVIREVAESRGVKVVLMTTGPSDSPGTDSRR